MKDVKSNQNNAKLSSSEFCKMVASQVLKDVENEEKEKEQQEKEETGGEVASSDKNETKGNSKYLLVFEGDNRMCTMIVKLPMNWKCNIEKNACFVV